MATETLTVDFSKAFPLFPLPGVVLLPHGVAPLHIFEDRYRAMTRRALDGAGLIAMASLMPGGGSGAAADAEADDEPPKLRPAVCLGYVSQHERLDDGRYHMLLQGIARAEIVKELAPHEEGFRRARLRPLGEPGADAEAVAAAADRLLKRRAELDALLADPELQKLAAVARLNEWLEDALPTEAVCDVVSMTLVQDDALRYALLAEGEAPRRLDAVLRFLQKTRAEMRSAEDAPRDAGGYLLN
ncbi:LON peptidase substrate-binding domain-containing protein [Phycisphaera mikurensis]|uniref:Lon N-terminal domain-containing protein n=1 Tax=Phycisphaera mikurensis (strain NBRC 102666 / KCTC 22515 / FYK2301M01) TaxID=1142394 RepID=I0IGS3_PHYMF|nr:LON peptidase substrate-binding domain-containing protein [Phycisphaera mikurensis]MBB6443250.1 Lon protease-like protein [Phycisphaera mikurensis]BAM04461.1 hypothetical protein PSMK_23020 [Phycisphaera mikurensis NBRC 102666]